MLTDVVSFVLTLIMRCCSSTAAMYLRPAMKQAGSRLSVLTDALVTRITFNKQQATGIEYRSGGQIKKAFASREVILSKFATWLFVCQVM